MARNRRELLSRIAAMRGPVDYATAKVLSTSENEDELKEALRELVARGLLFRRDDQAHYNLHPIVRQYAYDRLGDKMATHKALKDYFDTVPKPEKIESLDDLLPVIELFHHTIRSGGYEEALRVYNDRLADALYFQIGAYDVGISLKEAFFPDGVDQPPRLKDESDRAQILNALANACYATGQSRKAVGLIKKYNAICEKLDNKHNLAFGLGALAVYQMPLGELEGAESNLRHQIQIDKEVGDKWDESIGHQELGRLLTYIGRYDKADKELETAVGMFTEQNDDAGQCIVWSYRALRALLMDESGPALKAIDKARVSLERWTQKQYPLEGLLVKILHLSGAAKRCAGDTVGAETDLNEALARCRRIRLVELETDILLEVAKLQWQKAEEAGQKAEDGGLIEQAKSLTREALEIADGCEYRLQQADIQNFLAEMAFAEGDKAAALKHAETAKERVWCDGPPYCYKKALDEAEQMLAKLT